MNIYKRKIHSNISELCRTNNLSVLKTPCVLENIHTKEMLYFDSNVECAKFLNISPKTISSNIKRESVCKKKYKIFHR